MLPISWDSQESLESLLLTTSGFGISFFFSPFRWWKAVQPTHPAKQKKQVFREIGFQEKKEDVVLSRSESQFSGVFFKVSKSD